MKEPITLDKWDSLLVSHFKGIGNVNVDTVKAIWSQRCMLAEPYVHLKDVNAHLLRLVDELYLFEYTNQFVSFVESLNPLHNWSYITPPQQTNDFDFILLTRLASLFRHTEVKKLPGFVKTEVDIHPILS